MKTIFVVFTVCWTFTAIAGETKVWNIETWTGNVQDAGTDGEITLYICCGANDRIFDDVVLDDTARNNFERGQRDVFTYTSTRLKNLSRITLYNDRGGDGWLLSKITIEDVAAHRRYEWTPNKWIWRGHRDGRDYGQWFETPVLKTKVCDPGWYLNPHNARCYKYFTDRTYGQARSHCRELGGYIAMPKTTVDNEFLYNLKSRSKDLWIGLWIAGRGALIWEDHSHFNWTAYLSYFRVNPHDNKDVHEDDWRCVQLGGTMVGPTFETREPTYYRTSCYKRMDYVCERNKVCDPISQSCYEYNPEQGYATARQHCRVRRGWLPMPKTYREHHFLYNIKPEPAWIWLGLTDKETEGTFVWDDGTPVSWTKWDRRAPNNDDGHGNPENCVQLQGWDYHTWNDVPCSNNYTYFCVFENSGFRTQVATPTVRPIKLNITEDILATLQDSMDVIIRLETMCIGLGHERSDEQVWETFIQEDRMRLIEHDLNAITDAWRKVDYIRYTGCCGETPRINETHLEMLRAAMIRYPELFPYDHERLYYDFDIPGGREDYLRYNAQNALRDMEKANARLLENVQRLREQEARRSETNEWLSELYGKFQLS